MYSIQYTKYEDINLYKVHTKREFAIFRYL